MGTNSQIDGLQATLLTIKLTVIHEWNTRWLTHAQLYNKLLVSSDNINIPKMHPDVKHVLHLYVMRVKNRSNLQSYLKEAGIATGIHYPNPLPFLKAYDYPKHKPDDFPVVYIYEDKIISLTIFPEHNKNIIEAIICAISVYYNSN